MQAGRTEAGSAPAGRIARRARRFRLPVAASAVLAAALWSCCSGSAFAQGPGPIRLIVPAPAGGSLDASARLIAVHLAERIGEPVQVENRPGAATNIGTEYVVRSAPDGRTLLFGATALAINPSLYRLSFDPFRDLRPVVQISTEQYVLVVRNDLPASAPSELAKIAKEKPGGINCGAGPGPMMLACEQLRLELGGNVTSIPYAGIAPALNALLGAHVDLMFVPIEDVLGFVRAGRLRAIANASESRAASPFPELPLLLDIWPGFAVTGLYGILAPAGTPAETIAALNREINAVLSSPPVRERMTGGWQIPAGGTPEQFGDLLRRRHDYYQRLIREAGISVQ
jgi:tripartite-type tricarboxylate transporter receptor subunit TctC